MRLRSRLPARGALACALVVAATVGARAPATGATDENDAGRLDLNANVLVNESVGAGTAGHFAIRGRLFSEDLSARAREHAEARSERLSVANTLTFEPPDVAAEEYQAVRASLFDGYSTEVLAETREVREESPILALLMLVIGVPVVLVGGVSLGRFWARRRRVSA